jgi:hypothetical protein
MSSTMNFSFKLLDTPVEFGNAYSLSKVCSIHLNSSPSSFTQQEGKSFLGNLQGLRIQGTAAYGAGLGSNQTGIEVKGYRDAAGTELILEPTVGIIYLDMSGGKRSGVFSLDLIINLAPSDELFLFIKTVYIKPDNTVEAAQAGDTFTVTELETTCRRN